MKKRTILAVVAGVLFLMAGCSKFSPDESAVSVGKDGEIIGIAVESLDKDYYQEQELKSMIEKEVSGYTAAAGKDSVKMDKFSVDDKKAKLVMNYASGKDYSAFNKVEFFIGSTAQAQQAGKPFDGGFQSVEDGKAVKTGLTSKDVLSNDYQVVVMEESVLVKVPGTIVYVSDNVDVLGKDEAKVKSGSDEQGDVQESSQSASGSEQTEVLLLSPQVDNQDTQPVIGKKLAYIIYE